MVIFKKIDQYKEKGSFEGWIKRITINVALQKYRQRQKLQVVRNNEIESEEITVEIEEEIAADYLLELIQELPDQYRMVFNLYVLDHFSHKEISQMLDISVGSSKSNLSRARAILRDKIILYQHKKQEA